jgi:hypothetical protein
MRTVSLILAVTSLMACDPFRKAERRIDRPNGEVSNEQGVQGSVVKGSLQSNSSNIISDTTGSLVLPFESFAPRTGLDEMLALPEIQQRMPMADAISNITRLALANSGTPYALVVDAAGTLDIATETGGVCSGSVAFKVLTDLKDSGIAGTVEVEMDFDAVVCPEGSITGFVGLQAEFNALLAQLKIINIVQADVTDAGGEETSIDFAFRLETALLDALALDMSVAVDDDFYTLNIDGDLATGTATLTVVGRDGTVTCDITNSVAACTGVAQFNL